MVSQPRPGPGEGWRWNLMGFGWERGGRRGNLGAAESESESSGELA